MTASAHALELATVAARAAAGKLAGDVAAIDVSDHLVITDVFVLASAPSDRQVKAIVDGVEEALNALGVKPIRREGERDGRWVLLDFGEVVVHVQHTEERSYYSLERLWRDCPEVELPADVSASNEAARERANDQYNDAMEFGDGSGIVSSPVSGGTGA